MDAELGEIRFGKDHNYRWAWQFLLWKELASARSCKGAVVSIEVAPAVDQPPGLGGEL